MNGADGNRETLDTGSLRAGFRLIDGGTRRFSRVLLGVFFLDTGEVSVFALDGNPRGAPGTRR